MIWKFYINSIEVDEPVGWADVTWSAQRNDETHVIWFSAKADSFKWIGDAFDALQTEYELNGGDGSATLEIAYSCDNGETFEQFFYGSFDFNTYRRVCGDMCYAECSANPANCVNKFLSRINTDVDMEATRDLDGNAFTPEPLDTITLVSQNIVLNNKARNADGEDAPAVGGCHIGTSAGFYTFDAISSVFFPGETLEEWGVFNEYGYTPNCLFNEAGKFSFEDPANLESVKLLNIYRPSSDPLNCITGDATIDFRIKGTFNWTPQYDCTIKTRIRFDKFYISGYPTSAPRITMDLYTFGVDGRAVNAGMTNSTPFDYSFFLTPAYTNPDADFLLIYFYVEISKSTGGGAGTCDPFENINYDPETFFTMTYESACDNTTTEAISVKNAVCNLWNSYIGTEECNVTCEVPACIEDIYLTSGLKIRQVTDPLPAKIFLNFEDMFKNLSKIFNLGYGFWDLEANFSINTLDFWYNNNILLDLGSVREVRFSHATGYSYAKINVGYTKYELEEVNGLDEMNTTRTYRRSPSTINTELDLLCNFISAGYTWELTRRKIQEKTGTQDYRYDNDIFILHTYQDKSGIYPVQNNISTPANIISPTTRYNFYLTPIRNLMRWFKSIAAVIPDVTNVDLVFQSGKGNYIGEGQMTGDCSCDGQVIAENETIKTTIYSDADCYQPEYYTLFAEFEAPLSISDWIAIRGQPYDKFSFSCNSQTYSGHLIELDFNPNEGIGKFKLLLSLGGPSGAAILMEDSGYVLQEDNSYILME